MEYYLFIFFLHTLAREVIAISVDYYNRKCIILLLKLKLNKIRL
jgi:hypothetical protein